VDRDRLRTQRRTMFDKRGSRPRTGIWDSSHTLVTFALLRGARCGKAARRDLRGGAGSNSRPYRNSLENIFDLGADAVDKAESNTCGRAIASVRTTRRGGRHWRVRTLFAREPGGLGFDQSLYGLARIGKARSRSQ